MNWEIKRISDICIKVTDGAHHSPPSVDDGFPMASSKDMRENDFDLSNVRRISEADYDKLVQGNCKPKLGDVLIIKDGNSYLKYIFSVKEDRELVLLSSIAILRPDPKIVDSIFLQYMLRSPDTKKNMENYVSGAAIPRIVLKDFKSMSVFIPPLPTQRRIASILSAYDDLIENNLKRIKLLEEAAQNFYREWFVEMRLPGHDKVKWVEDEEGRRLPEGWAFQALESLCYLTMGQSPKSEYYNEEQRGLPFHQGVTGYGLRFVKNKTYCTVETRIARPYDILCSVRAPVGRLNITLDKMILGRGLSAIRNKHGFQSFQYYQLKAHFYQEDMIGGGAIFNSVTKKVLAGQLLLSPSRPVIELFESVVHPMDKQIEAIYKQTELCKEARDILLPRLMNQEIKL